MFLACHREQKAQVGKIDDWSSGKQKGFSFQWVGRFRLQVHIVQRFLVPLYLFHMYPR